MTLRSTKKLPISGQLFSVIILRILFFLLEFSAVFCFCGFALGNPLLKLLCAVLLSEEKCEAHCAPRIAPIAIPIIISDNAK